MNTSSTSSTPINISAWSPGTIGWLTLFFGSTSGLFLSTINWFRMRFYLKAFIHFSLGLVSQALFFYAYYLINPDLGVFATSNRYLFLLALFGLAIVISIYLHIQTKKDINLIQDSVANFTYANSLNAFVIIAGLRLLSAILFVISSNANGVEFQNYVYCELLQPGMSITEVEGKLTREIGPFIPITSDGLPNRAPDNVATFHFVVFEGRVEQWHDFRLGLGYDETNQLVWILEATNGSRYMEVDCPWTIKDSIQAIFN